MHTVRSSAFIPSPLPFHLIYPFVPTIISHATSICFLALVSSYLDYIQESVYHRLQQTQLGGVPGTLQLVRSFLVLRQANTIPGLEVCVCVCMCAFVHLSLSVCVCVCVCVSVGGAWPVFGRSYRGWGCVCECVYSSVSHGCPLSW